MFKKNFISFSSLSLFLLLLLSFPSISLAEESGNDTDCNYEQQTFTRKCVGRITRDLKLRYRDRRVHINSIYTIFQSEDQVMFVTFEQSALSDCRQIKISDENSFICIDSNQSKRIIRLSYSEMFCFNYHMSYMKELSLFCTPLLNLKDRMYSRSNILHYSKLSTSKSNTIRGQQLQLILWIYLASIVYNMLTD